MPRPRISIVSCCIALAACGAGDTHLDPSDLELRDLLGLAPERGDDDANLVLEATARAAPELAPWAPLVGVVADVEMADTPETASLEEQFRPARLAQTMLGLLRRLLPTATVLLFEDVHWMDEASSALLRELSNAVGGLPWLICTTRRDVGTGYVVAPDGGKSVRLAPLTEDAARRLAMEVASSLPIAPQQLVSLAERAAGNPLFLTELVATIAANDGL